MGQRFKSACTHIEVWTAGPRILNHPHELLLPLPPFWRQYSERKPRIHPSASLCAGATYIVVDLGESRSLKPTIGWPASGAMRHPAYHLR